jgi:CO/xanthine dehydrogenase FAD-binding subunit
MRAALSRLGVERPRTLAAAVGAMASASARPVPLAGGTDLFVYLNAGTQPDARYLDLSGVRELRGIRAGREGVEIGALATFAEIRADATIRRRLPSLAAAAAEVGAWQIQNRATLAGNIANASPAGDSLPVLLVHEAVVRARSRAGPRDVPCVTLFTGYRRLALAPDELIVSVFVPFPPARSIAFFRKVGTRRAQSISKVVFAGLLERDARGGVTGTRAAFGSMAPVPVRARAAEAALAGAPSRTRARAALDALAQDLAPIDDIRSEREYRMAVARNVLAQFLRLADLRYARG